MRFPLEIFDAVRAVFPADKPVGLRLSATDWVEGGWDVEQTIAYVNELKKRGVDWIDVSSGGVSPAQRIPFVPSYQVPFAQAVKEATGVNTMAVGLITEVRAGRRHRRERQGGPRRDRARDALRSSMAVARRGQAWRDREWASAILALASARGK